MPFETIAALFPCVQHGEIEDGAIALRPVTLAHIAAMETLGIDLDSDVKAGNSLIAAWVLTQDVDDVLRCVNDIEHTQRVFARWVRRTRFKTLLHGKDLDPERVANAVNRHLTSAFSTIVESAKEGDTQNFLRTGLGWVLELAEWYAHEYAQTIDNALREPISRVFALIACARQRNGGKHGGPDYFERVEMDGVKRRLAELKRQATMMKTESETKKAERADGR